MVKAGCDEGGVTKLELGCVKSLWFKGLSSKLSSTVLAALKVTRKKKVNGIKHLATTRVSFDAWRKSVMKSIGYG